VCIYACIETRAGLPNCSPRTAEWARQYQRIDHSAIRNDNRATNTTQHAFAQVIGCRVIGKAAVRRNASHENFSPHRISQSHTTWGGAGTHSVRRATISRYAIVNTPRAEAVGCDRRQRQGKMVLASRAMDGAMLSLCAVCLLGYAMPA
jgi:hypothetical protein